MTTKLQFKPSFGGTAIYLAREARRWPGPESPDWVAQIRPTADALAACLNSIGLSSETEWLGLLNAATHWESNQELATIFLKRVKGSTNTKPHDASRLAAAISTLEASLRHLYPDLEKELSLRVGPLREQWEARGPGILHRLATTTDPDLPPPEATVALVSPVHGGGGIALLASNTVVFEGVLVNGDAALPEAIRLAWLVAQLQLDLPKFSEAIHGSRLTRIAALALLPPIFEAAHFVELVASPLQDSPQPLANAIAAWVSPEGDVDLLAETLAHWWQAQVESRVPWKVALTGLDRLVDI